MATNYAANYIETLESETRYRLDMAARPMVAGKDYATQLFHCMKAAVADGRNDDAKKYALELRPLLGLLGE